MAVSYMFEMSEYEFVHRLTGCSEKKFFRLLEELNSQKKFFNALDKKHKKYLKDSIWERFQPWFRILYILIRIQKPEKMVETGTFSGLSTSIILLAMKKNRGGHLYSIDLPIRNPKKAKKDWILEPLPPGTHPGFAIPNVLRSRWELIEGDSGKNLPKLLEKLGEIEIFFHDSDHSYDHMMMEFGTAWPYIKSRGLLLADNVDWNQSFKDFGKKVGHKQNQKFGFGGILKH